MEGLKSYKLIANIASLRPCAKKRVVGRVTDLQRIELSANARGPFSLHERE
jgi:hypothetical protein